ncbi:MAG TPA: monovalent cation/H+ antiporter complex subunit F [Anaerolineales bacterium]|nr:monovalent cation/H+ antiporter complex subunit F [Anaerolineales bacterium]
MHVLTFYVAIVWSAILFGVIVFQVLRAKTVIARLLALDTLTLILIAFLILFVHANRADYYLDAVLTLALLSFIGTLAGSWYYGARSLSQ